MMSTIIFVILDYYMPTLKKLKLPYKSNISMTYAIIDGIFRGNFRLKVSISLDRKVFRSL